ncbi:hypothetical protein CVT26_009858 [Gymnopilus dilepis]|uniref:Uncharacterized protein n=1 Tax=Gymnopilus dilepis TaxID=231916 RepID=A0A409YC72_9AGAR|nr:hypothetical protein CVT26_009858 [Gymnopilus dilepis]
MNDVYHQLDLFDAKLAELRTFIERIKRGSETLRKSISAIDREIEDEKINLNALQDLHRVMADCQRKTRSPKSDVNHSPVRGMH